MIVKTLSQYDFINEFEISTERQKKVMYLIDICCGFTEYNTIEEAAEAYSISPIELEDATMVLHVLENGHVVVQKY